MDADEFLNNLFDKIEIETKNTEYKNLISDIFGG